jgi:Tfp pilus assembly protein PilV
MKEELIINKSCSGFSTLEMLIAMAILIMVISAVILVSFGSQSMLIGSQTNAEALNIAQGLLEKAQADSRKDFNLVNPVATTTTADGFTSSVNVVQTDYFTKLVTATVEFPEDSGRRGTTVLSAVVTNFNNAVGGDTCSSILLDSSGKPNTDAWKTPQVIKSFGDSSNNFSTLTGITDNYPITDVDAYKGKLYITINNSGAATDTVPTFFVFDINNPNTILPISGDFVDNDLTKQSGLNAVAVAEDVSTTTKKIYAYVASASSITKGQLQVIDVSSVPPVVVSSLPVGGQGAGNSIFYKDGYVYLGLKASTSGPEFHIIDVHTPTNPQEVGHWPKIGSLNYDINSIYMRGRYAYLATLDSKNLIVLDISNASDPVEVGSFNDGGGNYGKSVFLAGNVLYLGRTGGGTELSILDESDPVTTTPPVLYSESSINESVDGIIVRGKLNTQTSQLPPALAFLLTPSNFMIFDVSDSKNIGQWGTEPLETDTFGSSTFEPVLDCEGNNFFVGSNDSSNNGYISVITP